MKKRLISFLLVFAMVLTMLPMTALAAPSDGDTSVNPANPFTDVKETDWFYDAVQYARVNGLVNGATATMFDPDGGMTRGMFVTILGRMAGVDTQEYVGQSVFDDVSVSMYYAPYVAWAYKHGIVNGTGGNQFSPNMKIDRQQLATFFVRYCEAFDVKYGEDTVNTQPADIDEVADWAKDSVLKLWSKGILNGDGTNFNPTDEASRAEAVTLSTRMDTAVETWYSEPGVESDRVRIDPATGEAIKSDDKESEKPGTDNWYDDYYGGYDPGGEITTSYLVEFAIGDLAQEIKDAATPPQSKTYAEGTKIEHLPAPSMQNGLFLGWYYDAALTQPVPADATVTKSLKLYAKMGTVSPVSEEDTPRYITVQVAADNVATYSFKIKGAFNADDVTFLNVSANNQEYTRSDTLSEYDAGGNPLYQYKAVSDGEGGYVITSLWKPGQTYSIKLADDSSAVFVVGGAEQTTHIRTLNIITDKAEVMQLSVDDGVRYIAKDHENLSGMSDSLKGLFTVALQSVTPEGNEGKPESEQGKDIQITPVADTGTFTFTGEAELSDNSKVALQVGDTVAIYTGTRPDKRGLTSDLIAADADAEDPNGSVAYVEITDINGSVYTYKTAESEDVLFTPDVLPLLFPANNSVSLADDSEGGTFTVPVADMTYTDDVYAQMGLDSQTQVEAGDFIMFYLNGDKGLEDATAAGSNPYARITKVVESDGNYTIDWVPATEAEVMAAMDLYDTRNQAIVQDDKTIEEMENEMVRQAIESGFVDEAAEYLVALALETDGFEKMDGDMDLSSYSITFEDGTPVDEETMALMAGNKAEITKKEVAANIMAGPVLQHFEDSTGLRAELGMEFTVEVDLGNDNKIVIQLEAIFEQEVLLNINVSGGAVWKKAWIFPYIADYQMTANLDVGTYTGIAVTATVKTVAPEDEEEEEYKWESVTDTTFENVLGNVGEIIKDTDEAVSKLNDKVEGLNDKIEELIDKGEHFLDIPTAEIPSAGLNGTESVGTVDDSGLAERYSAMMSEVTDNWIEIVRVEIFSSEGHVDPLHILCYGIGADFVVSATMHVTVGMTFQFGVAKRYAFSLKLFARECTTETVDLEEANYSFKFYVMGTIGVRAGIEFEVAVGLFSLKLDSIGIAAEVGAYAQMWGYFYYELTWSKSEGKDSRCSGALFIEIGIYLSISFKAQLFSYDKLTYNPTLYEKEWPLWSAGEAENVYEFYYPESPDDISEEDFEDEDSGEVDTEAYEEEVAALTELLLPVIEGARSFTLSADLFNMNYMDMKTGVLHGSDFEEEEEEDDGFSFGDLIPGGDEDEEPHENSFPKNYDSNQSGNGDADDEKHFMVDVSNEYFSYDPTTNTVTVTAPKGTEQTCEITFTWKGNALAFSTKPMSRTVTITWSDPANAKFIAFDSRGGSAVPLISTGVGQDISAHKSTKIIPTKVGYTFEGWYEKVEDFGDQSKKFQFTTMGDYPEVEGVGAGITLYANWTPNSDTKYTVEHYFEELNGKYVLYADMNPDDRGWTLDTDTTIENKTGTTDELTQAQVKQFTGFVSPSAEELAAAQQSIAPDGSTVVKLYYKRAEYTATFGYGDIGTGMDPVVSKAKYMGTVAVPALALVGYDFTGFDGLSDKSIRLDTDKSYTATWAARNDTPYRAELYVEKTDGSGYVLAADPNAIQHLTGTTGASIDPTSNAIAKLTDAGLTYSGATVNGVAVSESNPAVITTDGKLVIKLLYDRVKNGVTFDSNGGTAVEALENVRYGAKLTEPEAPTKEGWTFAGWYTAADFTEGTKVDFDTYTMPTSAVTLYAKWDAKDGIEYKVEHYQQKVSYDAENDYELAATDNKTGKNGAETQAEAKTYTGFKPAKEFQQTTIAADGSTVVKIYYDRETYTVTFNPDGGSTVPAQEGIRYQNKAEKPSDPTKQGYQLEGWYNGDTKWNFSDGVIENIELTAKWEEADGIAYTVKVYEMGVDGSYGEPTSQTKYGKTNAQVSASTTAESGFTYDEENAGNVISGTVAADGSLVLKVYFKRNQYTVTYNPNGGVIPDAEGNYTFTGYYGAAVTKPADPTKTGYTFAGWSKTVATVPLNGDTVTAEWTANTYTVKFDKNAPANVEIDGSMDDVTFTYDEEQALADNGFILPANSGYTFMGWSTTPNATQPEYFNKASVKNLSAGAAVTLYAVWQIGDAVAYTVEHWQQNVENNEFTKFETETPSGIKGQLTAAAAKNYDGFTAGSVSNVEITGEGIVIRIDYTRNSYTITFDSDEGTAVAPITAKFGAGVEAPADPTKTGYTFSKWNQEVPATMPAGDMTLTAQWTINQYTISFEENGGSNVTDIKQDYNTTVTAPTDPTKEGYAFGGWYSDAELENKYTFSKMPAEDITLYAKWNIKQYTITFDEVGGSEVADITQNYGTAVTAPADPTKTGYTFAGWDKDIPDTMPAGGMTIKAQWNINKYTITFDEVGGSPVEDITADYAAPVSKPADPTKTGYEFLGWSTDGTAVITFPATMPVDGMALKAVWQINSYNLTWDLKGGTVEGDYTNGTVEYGASITAPADPTKTGYTFAGWNKTIPTTMPAENVIITAQWTAIEYTITYDLNDGAWPSDTTPLEKYTIETESQFFAQPTRDQYQFVGWYTDSGFAENTKVTGITKGDITKGNITLYAKWEHATYSITYTLNGGTNHADNPNSVAVGSSITLQSPTKQYHDFLGWSGPGITGNVVNPTVAPVNDSTYTANWIGTEYSYNLIVTNSNGASLPAGAPGTIYARFGETLGTLPTPIRPGYEFVTWFYKYDSTPVTAETVINKDFAGGGNLFVTWKVGTYKINYFGVDNTNGLPGTYTYDQDTSIANPTKTGYTFLGWKINEGSDVVKNLTLAKESYTANITLTAVWEASTYTVTLDLNDDGDALTSVASKTVTVTYDSTYGTLPTPTRPGYKFVGWFTTAEGGTQVTDETTVTATANHTLYAHWTLDTVLIYKDGNGGSFADGGYNTGWRIPYTGTDTTYDAFLNDPEEKDPPERDGYIFLGWNTAADGSGAWITADDKLTTRATHTLYAQWGYGVVVGGVHVFAGNASNVLGDGKVSYDLSTNTLTLSNAIITGSTEEMGVIHVKPGTIASTAPFTVSLVGTNSITYTADTPGYGIYAECDLTITGGTNADLTVKASNAYYGSAIKFGGGLSGQAKLRIKDGCTVTVLGGAYGYGVDATGVGLSTIHVLKGNLIAKGGECAVKGCNDIYYIYKSESASDFASVKAAYYQDDAASKTLSGNEDLSSYEHIQVTVS